MFTLNYLYIFLNTFVFYGENGLNSLNTGIRYNIYFINKQSTILCMLQNQWI